MDCDELAGMREVLLNSSFAIGTIGKYSTMWNMFVNFLLDMHLLISLSGLCQYVEYLFVKGPKHNSIHVHLCAIAHGLKVREIPDYTKAYIITVMLKGARRLTM